MNIAQTQKMNNLVGDLTKNGRVDNFEDAVTMAGNIYDNGLPEAQVTEDGSRMRELELRIRNQLSNVVMDINAELGKIWQVLEEMQRNPPPEVDSTADLQAQQDQPQSEPPAESSERPEEPQQETQQQGQPQAGEHPRTGNNNSDDVDLEKFFYFGQK
jgi:hypothetical protein